MLKLTAYSVRLFCLILVFIGCGAEGAARSQELNFQPYPEIDLPSHECYGIYQDKKGYLWISTKLGLCVYDGFETRSVILDPANKNDDVYVMKEDPFGRLWMVTSRNTLYVKVGETFFEPALSKTYAALLKEAFLITYDLYFTETEVGLITQNASYECAYNSNQWTKTDSGISQDFSFSCSDDGLRYMPKSFTKDQRSAFNVDETYTLAFHKGGKITYQAVPYRATFIPGWRVLTAHCGARYDVIARDKVLVIVDRGNLETKSIELDHAVLSVCADEAQGLWVGTSSGGLYYIPDLSDPDRCFKALSELSVSSVIIDQEGSIWCTTLENGVYYCRSKEILNYRELTHVSARNHVLYQSKEAVFGISTTAIHNLSDPLVVPVAIPVTENEKIQDVLQWAPNYWLVAGDQVLLFLDARDGSFDTVQMGFKELLGVGQQVYALQTSFLGQIDLKKKVKVGFIPAVALRTMISTSDSTLLLSGKSGMFEFNGTDTLLPADVQVSNVINLLEDQQNRLWVCSQSEGLVIIMNGKKINLSHELLLRNVYFTDLAEAPDGTIWCSSNQGIFGFGQTDSKLQVTHFSVSDGLYSNEISQLACDSTRLYCSSLEGIQSIPLSWRKPVGHAPPVWLEAVCINRKRCHNGSEFILGYAENNLELRFDAPFFHQGDQKIACILEDISSGNVRRYTPESDLLLLANLDAGEYVLTTYALNNNGQKSEKPLIVKFTIAKPFWLAWWFILLEILLASGFVWYLVQLGIKRTTKRERERAKLERLVVEAQLTAIQAQMNPHFIFNAISSIQNYILTKRDEEAFYFLNQFSKLIRLVLANSERNFISLDQELDIIKLYVQLEQMRFENKFEFELKVRGLDEQETYLPFMTIQPYVENAIWHGIMNLEKGKKGLLRLEVDKKDDLLQIRITDNGVGRREAATFATGKNKSMGMSISGKRLEILRHIFKSSVPAVEIIDLFAAEDNLHSLGTQVVIQIPHLNGAALEVLRNETNLDYGHS